MNSIEESSSGSGPNRPLKLKSQKGAATLQGWKNIAFELDRGVRTVQRWERDLGLPVHRIGKTPRRPVFAFAEELYSWLRKTDDLRSRAGSSVVNQSLQEQKDQIRIVNRLPDADLVEGRPRYRQAGKTSHGRNLQDIIKFLADGSSGRLPGNCEQCHSPLSVVEGHLRISGAEQNWVLPIIFCPVCDLERVDHPRARQCITFLRSAFPVASPVETSE